MEKEIKGATVYITGGTKGIGEAVARYLAEKEANVIIFGRSEEEGKKIERGHKIKLICVIKSLHQKKRSMREEKEGVFTSRETCVLKETRRRL